MIIIEIMNKIDIDSEEKRIEVYRVFDSFNKKDDIYRFYGISPNNNGIDYIKNIALQIGFDLNVYHNRRFPKRYCLTCGKLLKKGQKKFCSHPCSAFYNNQTRGCHSDNTKNKIKEKLISYYKHKKNEQIVEKNNPNNKVGNKRCKICGSEECSKNDVCKHHSINWFSNLECFGFDLKTIGTSQVFYEYKNIADRLKNDYENGLSVAQIKDKYNYPFSVERLVKVINNMGISLRNRSEAVRNGIKQGRCKLPEMINHFNYGWHNTWDGHKVFYRSSYELDVCLELDRQKIHYELENLCIEYYDTMLNKKRYAIPDFYIPSKNKIIEVKSRVTFIKQNMIDKMEEYKKLGYSVELNYEHKVYTFEEMKELKQYKFTI